MSNFLSLNDMSSEIFSCFFGCLDCPSLVFILQVFFREIASLPPYSEVRRPFDGISGCSRRGVDPKLPIVDMNRRNFLQQRRYTRAAQDSLNDYDLDIWAAGHP